MVLVVVRGCGGGGGGGGGGDVCVGGGGGTVCINDQLTGFMHLAACHSGCKIRWSMPIDPGY